MGREGGRAPGSDDEEDETRWNFDTNGYMDLEDVESEEVATVRQALDLTWDFHHQARPLALGRSAQEVEACVPVLPPPPL